MTKLMTREKPYPLGYEAPSMAGYYMEKPTLNMAPFVSLDLEESKEELPKTLVLRARVEVQRATHWPVLEDGRGAQWSLGRDELYTEEGRALKDQARVLSISLTYTGFWAIPYPEGMLLPWEGAGDLLPIQPGETFFHHAFAPLPPVIPLSIPDGSSLRLFSLGGCLRHVLSPLSTTPLYFFQEHGASTPNVRLLFWSDVAELKANPRGPTLILPEEDASMSPEAALLSGMLTVTLEGLSYRSVHVNPIPGDGGVVDVVVQCGA
jgi:hypothetical protein